MTDRSLIATILLDSVDGDYSTTIAINGKVVRIEPTQTLGCAMLFCANAILEERERAARAALPDVDASGSEHP